MATGSVSWGSNGCEEKDGSSDQGTSPSSHVQIFILSGYHGRPTRGTVTIHDFNRAQRWRRALRGVSTWWSAGLLVAISLNSAANGGLRYLGIAWAVFAAGAALWASVHGLFFAPATGPLVTGL